MTPLYVHENYYKRMLDLQEKLRKSEEERIRLEERFNNFVQEARNRHQTCINRLRLHYVEFLKEQKARDERNNKILDSLDSLNNSLVSMSAKTERINILRKQYEVYLLRTYCNHQPNESFTTKSGLETQINQEKLAPSLVSPKSNGLEIPKNIIPNYSNQDFTYSQYKAPTLDDMQQKFSILQKPTDVRRNLNFATENEYSKNIFQNDSFSLNHQSKSFPSTVKTIEENESRLRNIFDNSVKLLQNRPSINHNLDSYLDKIKGLHEESNNVQHSNESQHSFGEADNEQNTSGDILNVTLSDDELKPFTTEVEKNKEVRKPPLFASQSFTRNMAHDYINNQFNGQDPTYSFRVPAFDKISKPQLAADSSHQRDLNLGLKVQQPIENTLAKFSDLDEPIRPIQQNRSLLHTLADNATLGSQETINNDNTSDEEFKEDGNDGIEDDYDHTVDIETWMPDNVEEPIEEVHATNSLRNIPRRQLESIEEVEPSEDEEPIDKTNEYDQHHIDKAFNSNETSLELINEPKQDIEDLSLQENSQKQNNDSNKNLNANDEDSIKIPPSYELNNNEQNQNNSEYLENHNKRQIEKQQQYQHSDSFNKQYTDNENDQYDEYKNQKNNEEQDVDSSGKQYQQYDENKVREYDSNEEYQHHDDKHEESNVEEIDKNQYKTNETYDNIQESQPYPAQSKINLPQSNERIVNDDSMTKHNEKSLEIKNTGLDKESNVDVQQSKDNLIGFKGKKDPIKSILDSDSESFIERNLSNTESDFEFN